MPPYRHTSPVPEEGSIPTGSCALCRRSYDATCRKGIESCGKGRSDVAALLQVGQDNTCAKGKHGHRRQRPVHGLLLGRKLVLQTVQY